MTDAEDSWSELRSAWKSGTPDDGVRVARAAVSRAMRRSLVARTGLVVFAVAITGGALVHAANPLEAALGLITGVAIAAAWWVSATTDRRTQAVLAEPAEDYRELRAEILRAQIRFFRFVWLVLALQLVFLVPWWIGGISAHRGEGLFGSLMLVAFWLPLAGMVMLFGWTVRRSQLAARELSTGGAFRKERASSDRP